MKVLVTGATGLVGNNVVRMLLDRGDTVRVLARNPQDRSLEGLPLDVVQGDVCDAASVREAARGVDLVIHSAARVHIGWSGLELQQTVNVGGTQNVALAAKDEGVRMVHVSSVDALGIGTRANPANEDAPPVGNIPCSYVITKARPRRHY